MPAIDCHFTNIQHHITAQIQSAQANIRIAVAWFTDAHLFNLLRTKAANGVKVELLLQQDEINQLCGIDHQLLHNPPLAHILWVAPDGFTRMHNKFCIIDHHTIITGSYNWTKQAQQNDENIVIISHDPDFAAGYISHFYFLWQRHGGALPANTPDMATLRLRLQILYNALELADADDITTQTAKTAAQLPHPPPAEWQHLLQLLQQQQYPQATAYLAQWLQKMSALALFTDDELEALKFELLMLERQINALQDEKTDLETLLTAFERRYYAELGELLYQIQQLQAEQAKQQAEQNPDNPKAQETFEQKQREFEAYEQAYRSTQAKHQHAPHLSPDDENLLNKLYKKAAKLCHPDIIQDETLKVEAERIFKELQNAKDAKDIPRIQQILDYLENGKPFEPLSSNQLTKDQLRARIIHLRQVIHLIAQEITRLRNSEAYKIVSTLGNNWDAYFAQAKLTLQNQLHHLKKNKPPL